MTSATTVRPAPPASPGGLVRPSDVGGEVAWSCLVREGALVVLAEGGVLGEPVARRATTPGSPLLRARVLAPLVPAHTAVAGLSAAWLHLGGRLPDRVDVVYRSGSHRPRTRPGVVARQAALLAADVTRRGDVVVTSVQRTGLDLARADPPVADLPRLLARLGDVGFDASAALRTLARRPRLPGRAAAERALRGGATSAPRLTPEAVACAPPARR